MINDISSDRVFCLKCVTAYEKHLLPKISKHKPTFIGLLKNTPRNSGDAALVKKAATEGISLPLVSSMEGSESSKQKLPASIVEEAMIVSEMFEMNEISALQLLLQGNI